MSKTRTKSNKSLLILIAFYQISPGVLSSNLRFSHFSAQPEPQPEHNLFRNEPLASQYTAHILDDISISQ